MKHNRKLRITQKDFLLANRRASRAEEIEAHGKQIQFRTAIQKSQKVYDRSRLKRAAIKSDDGSYCFSGVHSICGGSRLSVHYSFSELSRIFTKNAVLVSFA